MDWPEDQIDIRYYADEWGPFLFELVNSETGKSLIPSGTTITSVSAKAYAGMVDPLSDLSAKTDTSGIIDSVTHDSSTTIIAHFQYLLAARGMNTIIFEVTLDTGAKQAFYFYGVNIQGQGAT